MSREHDEMAHQIKMTQSPGLECSQRCEGCPPGEGSDHRRVEHSVELSGGPMALAAAGVFLGPLAAALAGAMVSRWFWASQYAHLVGGLAGLAAGAAVAAIIARRISATRERNVLLQRDNVV